MEILHLKRLSASPLRLAIAIAFAIYYQAIALITMPPKKRKTPDTTSSSTAEPVKKKMTAKERREALERARTWAIHDAEAKGMKSPAKKRRTSLPSTEKTTKATATTATAKDNVSSASAATTPSRRKSTMSPGKSTTTKKEKQIPISTRKSKKQKMKEAQERAAAWAAGRKTQEKTNVKQEKTEEEEDVEDDKSMESADVDADNEEEQEAGDQLNEDSPPPPIESPEKEQETKSKEQAQFEARARAAAWGKEDKRKKKANTTVREVPPNYDKSNQIAEETRRRSVIEIPPHIISPLESGTKRRELKEEIINQNVETTNTIIEGANEELIDVVYEEDDVKPWLCMKFIMKILVLAGALGLVGTVFAFLNYDHDFEFDLSIAKDLMPRVVGSKGSGPRCYLDSADDESAHGHHDISTPKSLLDKGIESCQGDLIPCPDLGTCYGGYLRSCWPDHHFEVSEALNACVLKKPTLDLIDQLESALVNLTVEHFCYWVGSNSSIDVGGTAPMFLGENVANFPLDDHTIVLVLNHAARASSLRMKSTIDDEIMIGLSDDYVNSRLPLPFDCWIRMVALAVMSFIWKHAIVKLFWFLIKVLEFVAITLMKYPLASFVASCFLWVIRTIRLARRSRRQVRTDAVRVRELAYEKLQHQAQEYAVLHLRDEVAHELYPSSKKQRAYIIKEVWPRVVSDVTHDNRISKSCALLQGKTRDIWTWVAPKTTKRQDSH